MNVTMTQRQLDALCDAVDAHMTMHPATAATAERYATLNAARAVLSSVRLAPDPRRITVRHPRRTA